MAHHLVCVALRDAPAFDYAKLHAELQGIGLQPTYQTAQDTYQLPPGLYYQRSDQAATTLLEAVRLAVRRALQNESTLIKARNFFPMILVSDLKALDGLPTLKAPRRQG